MENNQVNQTNDKGQRHGLWKKFWYNRKLWYKCNYQNGKYHGIYECYYSNGKLWDKGYCKNNKRMGLWLKN